VEEEEKEEEGVI